ncbi:nitroreductase family protein [Clostridium coskatii]|jgi:nitroreductase|uniref:Nitroreductase domain-containing protein n=1 Tax=Clostridium coskatii TaxID=1705578 RepID=A0A166TDA3_9CLOT|nr:nitroreductase family protein [Clostridium coskatii]OAA93540.1 hypothetical protein WX73_04305 [Clostridium coskatii]OBR96329.1 hypothetical protein CLCOS_10420 [Clostridium coskatii]
MGIEAIYNRRSIRKYTSKEIPVDIFNKILDAARTGWGCCTWIF